MASTYDLNARLKERARQKQQKEDAALALDDVSRVKVLSPGRKVVKRFIRNRLAVFGSVTLIILFAFSFLGPLVYPYGQKQIFYTFETQNVDYALAKQSVTYNGYDVDDSVELDRTVVSSMNSNIKSMNEAGIDRMVGANGETGYVIERVADNVYTLGAIDLTKVATAGSSTSVIGTYSMVGKTLEFTGDPIEGLEEAVVENAKGKSGSFTFDGVEYSYERGAAKTYEITAASEGITVLDGDLDAEEFSKAVDDAVASGSSSLTFEGTDYVLVQNGDSWSVFEPGDETIAKVYTNYSVNTYETGVPVSNEFKAQMLMALVPGSSGSFTADGKTYTVKVEGDTPVIFDESGAEFAELDVFTVRRFTGEDTLNFDLKTAIAAKVVEMAETGSKSATLVHDLPMQDEDGGYAYDDKGNLLYSEADLLITQRNTGEYVINCDQIKYVIDRYAAPSWSHPLGTDGDGFDVMARIMYGGRISLMVGFVVIIIETVLGVILGGLAGYYGGWVDNLIMRLVDIFYCLPMLPIMIIIGAMMDAARMDTYLRLMVMMAALGVMGWASVARLVRGQILALREQEFMVAAEATGIRVRDRIFRHLIPNVMPQLIVIATMGIGGVIITESTLSFLGLGVKHPLATWGTIINSVSSASAMAHYAFIWIPVGLLISLTVVAFNFVGDGLRDAYDPKSKK